MTRQPNLALMISDRSACLTVEAARAALGIDEDSVLSLIDTGDLRWAWDISLRRGQVIREVRIWARSVIAHQHGEKQPGAAVEQVIEEILGTTPPQRARASVVRSHLCCSQQHIQRLVEQGEISAVVARRTRWVETDSVRRFLMRRVIQ